MIVVIGSPLLQPGDAGGAAHVAGRAGRIAVAAAAADRSVQLVGKVGDDAAGDALLIALTAAGVGHAAILRDAARARPAVAPATTGADDEPFWDDEVIVAEPGLALEPADVQLALRYLTDFQVVVLAGPIEAGVLAMAADAAEFAGAHLIRLDGAMDAPNSLADVAVTSFEAPRDDELAFAAMVGHYAAGLDVGRSPADAFMDATRRHALGARLARLTRG